MELLTPNLNTLASTVAVGGPIVVVVALLGLFLAARSEYAKL